MAHDDISVQVTAIGIHVTSKQHQLFQTGLIKLTVTKLVSTRSVSMSPFYPCQVTGDVNTKILCAFLLMPYRSYVRFAIPP
jgi:hypothetical protein